MSLVAANLKSDNLQYNTLGRWDKRLIDQVSDVPNIICINCSNFFMKMKIKSFECPKSIRNYEKKNNAWNIRRLVDESFVLSTQQPSVLLLKIVGFLVHFYAQE